MDIAIQAVISILGFVTTYLFMRKSFKNELSKQKSTLILEEMSKLPYQILMFYEKILNLEGKPISQKNVSEIIEIYYKIYSYGTIDAIKIITEMQKNNYISAINPNSDNENRVLPFCILLVCQIKYDISDILISPLSWYILKIKDFDQKLMDNYIKANNDIVNELNLNSGFLIS